MSKFLCKVLILIIALIVCILPLNLLYLRRCSKIDETSKFKEVPYNIEVCNFGSSHGYYGFCYNDYDNITTFNFALTSQSFLYDYRIMQYYKDNIEHGAVVFIPVSYFSLYGFPENKGDNFRNTNQRYYEFLPAKFITDYSIKDDFLTKFPSLTAYEGIAGIFFKESDIGLQSAYTAWKDNTWNRKAYDIDVHKDAEEAYERHIVKNKTDQNGNHIINTDNYDALYGMINMCKENGWCPVLVTTPYLREYTDVIDANSPKFFEYHKEVMDKIISDNDIEYFDYSRDERFIDDYDLFLNSDHLNKDGAIKFTDILLDEVVNVYKLK